MSVIPPEFYKKSDVIQISQDLLGKFIMTSFDEDRTGGMIIETEAYRGAEDRASHAYNNRRTKRTDVMFLPGGVAYVYLCYGMHHLFNIVTNVEGIPHAVLIRAIAPTDGVEIMRQRRNKTKEEKNFTIGPATVTQALGINITHSNTPLTKPPIWVEDRGIAVKQASIITGPRVGVDYAGEDALLPWRFRMNLKEER